MAEGSVSLDWWTWVVIVGSAVFAPLFAYCGYLFWRIIRDMDPFYYREKHDRSAIYVELSRRFVFRTIKLHPRYKRAFGFALIIFEAFQILSFSFTRGVPWHWSPIQSIMNSLALSFFKFNFVITFWIIASLYVLYIISQRLPQNAIKLLGKSCKIEDMKPVNDVLRHSGIIFVDLLYIPAAATILSPIVCTYEGYDSPVMDDDVSILCWQGIHFLYVVFGLLVFGVLFPLALRYAAKFKNELDPALLYIPRYNVLLLGFKTLLVLNHMVTGDRSVISSSIRIVLTVALLALTIYYQPCCGRNSVVNNIRVALFSAAVWSSLFAFIVSIVYETNPMADIGIGHGLLIGLISSMPFVLGFAFYLNNIRSTKINIPRVPLHHLLLSNNITFRKIIMQAIHMTLLKGQAAKVFKDMDMCSTLLRSFKARRQGSNKLQRMIDVGSQMLEMQIRILSQIAQDDAVWNNNESRELQEQFTDPDLVLGALDVLVDEDMHPNTRLDTMIVLRAIAQTERGARNLFSASHRGRSPGGRTSIYGTRSPFDFIRSVAMGRTGLLANPTDLTVFRTLMGCEDVVADPEGGLQWMSRLMNVGMAADIVRIVSRYFKSVTLSEVQTALDQVVRISVLWTKAYREQTEARGGSDDDDESEASSGNFFARRTVVGKNPVAPWEEGSDDEDNEDTAQYALAGPADCGFDIEPDLSGEEALFQFMMLARRLVHLAIVLGAIPEIRLSSDMHRQSSAQNPLQEMRRQTSSQHTPGALNLTVPGPIAVPEEGAGVGFATLTTPASPTDGGVDVNVILLNESAAAGPGESGPESEADEPTLIVPNETRARAQFTSVTSDGDNDGQTKDGEVSDGASTVISSGSEIDSSLDEDSSSEEEEFGDTGVLKLIPPQPRVKVDAQLLTKSFQLLGAAGDHAIIEGCYLLHFLARTEEGVKRMQQLNMFSWLSSSKAAFSKSPEVIAAVDKVIEGVKDTAHAHFYATINPKFNFEPRPAFFSGESDAKKWRKKKTISDVQKLKQVESDVSHSAEEMVSEGTGSGTDVTNTSGNIPGRSISHTASEAGRSQATLLYSDQPDSPTGDGKKMSKQQMVRNPSKRSIHSLASTLTRHSDEDYVAPDSTAPGKEKDPKEKSAGSTDVSNMARVLVIGHPRNTILNGLFMVNTAAPIAPVREREFPNSVAPDVLKTRQMIVGHVVISTHSLLSVCDQAIRLGRITPLSQSNHIRVMRWMLKLFDTPYLKRMLPYNLPYRTINARKVLMDESFTKILADMFDERFRMGLSMLWNDTTGTLKQLAASYYFSNYNFARFLDSLDHIGSLEYLPRPSDFLMLPTFYVAPPEHTHGRIFFPEPERIIPKGQKSMLIEYYWPHYVDTPDPAALPPSARRRNSAQLQGLNEGPGSIRPMTPEMGPSLSPSPLPDGTATHPAPVAKAANLQNKQDGHFSFTLRHRDMVTTCVLVAETAWFASDPRLEDSTPRNSISGPLLRLPESQKDRQSQPDSEASMTVAARSTSPPVSGDEDQDGKDKGKVQAKGDDRDAIPLKVIKKQSDTHRSSSALASKSFDASCDEDEERLRPQKVRPQRQRTMTIADLPPGRRSSMVRFDSGDFNNIGSVESPVSGRRRALSIFQAAFKRLHAGKTHSPVFFCIVLLNRISMSEINNLAKLQSSFEKREHRARKAFKHVVKKHDHNKDAQVEFHVWNVLVDELGREVVFKVPDSMNDGYGCMLGFWQDLRGLHSTKCLLDQVMRY